MPTVEVRDGASIYYEERGSGSHYILGARNLLEHVGSYTTYLADLGYHVIEIQLRGYGHSSRVSEDYGNAWYDIWADDVCDVADALGIDKFVYTGVSHGAGVGWHILRRHPERMQAFMAIVCGPHSKDGKSVSASRQRELNAADDPVAWSNVCKKRLEEDLADIPDDISEEDKRLAQENAREKHNYMLHYDTLEKHISPRKPFPDISTEEELVEELKKVHCPCLLIGALRDPVSTPANMIRTASSIANSKLIMYQNSGHALQRNYAGAIAKDIDNYLKDHGKEFWK